MKRCKPDANLTRILDSLVGSSDMLAAAMVEDYRQVPS